MILQELALSPDDYLIEVGFGSLPDPVAALRELWRVLGERGRLVVLGSDPSMRGTPAAPEPMASRLRFYEDDELQQLAEEAGFLLLQAYCNYMN